jgi:pyruvate formate lyase activating enzyme
MSTGMIFDIKRYAINDGPGIRTAVFLKGCPLDCWWCHNPEGKSARPQLIFRENRCKDTKECLLVCPRGAISWKNGSITDWANCDDCGKCAEVCYAGARELVGYPISISQLIAEIKRDIPFYDQSEGGVTFTGGEPLLQKRFLMQALLACKENHIHTVVDTCGYASWTNFKPLLPSVDLFLYDIKLMNEEKHIKYTTVSNGLIISNLRKLSSAGAHIIVRIPLIPEINDDAENLEQCAAFLAGLPQLDGVALMPYHDIGLAKYRGLGMDYKLSGTKSPAEERVMEIEEFFADFNLPVIRSSRRSA